MKKHSSMRRSNRTFRLALSYLAIIMLLCIGFSVLFYQTSTRGLHLSLEAAPRPAQTDGSDAQDFSLQANGGAASFSLAGDPAGDVSRLNAQLEQQVGSFRQDLARRLVLFNAAALIIGMMLSYFLARYTLRPIEGALALQARFSSDASHELRTPLAALRSHGEVALRDANLTLPKAKKVIENSVSQTYKLEKLADALLRLNREDGSNLVMQAVSLEEIANEAMNSVIQVAQKKRITIEENVPHVFVRADRQSLEQAVIILLDNAIKYSPPKSRIYLDGAAEGSHAILRIRDEGIGMAHDDLAHIFERFYRADTSRSQDGYGLGLSIAHKIITQHGGTINAQSEPGSGSVFTIALPASKL